MNLLKCCLDNPNIKNFIDDLIENHNRKHFEDLYDSELEQLAGFIILMHQNSSDLRGNEIECLSESNHIDQTMSVYAKYLMRQTNENKNEFLEIMKKNTANYYKELMNDLFDERLSFLETNKLNDAGYHQEAYEDNGETYWLRD